MIWRYFYFLWQKYLPMIACWYNWVLEKYHKREAWLFFSQKIVHLNGTKFVTLHTWPFWKTLAKDAYLIKCTSWMKTFPLGMGPSTCSLGARFFWRCLFSGFEVWAHARLAHARAWCSKSSRRTLRDHWMV